MILCISIVSIVTSPFSFLILLIWILFFFLMSLTKHLSILFIFSKNQLLVSLIFAVVFCISISFISAMIFMISFLLLTLGFVCFLSLVALGVRIGCLKFFLFLEVGLYWYKLRLQNCFCCIPQILTSLVAQTVKHLPTMQETGVDPWVGKILWRRKWHPTPVLLPGKSHGWRSLVGYSPWGHEESDTTERLHFTSQILNCVFIVICFQVFFYFLFDFFYDLLIIWQHIIQSPCVCGFSFPL